MTDEGIGERIEAGRHAKGWSKAELAERAGFRPQRYAAIIDGRLGRSYWPRIAKALGCRIEFLTTGAMPPEWYRPKGETSPREEPPDKIDTKFQIPFVGTVTAGGGWAEPSQDIEDYAPITIPKHWRAVKIQGDSGFPVVWDGQTVLVDDRLPLRHNRLVVVQTQDRRAYLKRYCVTDHAEAGFILASINIGKDSLTLPADQDCTISVVVGTLFTDSVVPVGRT